MLARSIHITNENSLTNKNNTANQYVELQIFFENTKIIDNTEFGEYASKTTLANKIDFIL